MSNPNNSGLGCFKGSKLSTLQQMMRFIVMLFFSSYEAGIRTDTYRLLFTSKEKEQALAHYINSSVWETELTPTTEDLILTLSTCTGRGTYESRWVVQAVLEGKWNK